MLPSRKVLLTAQEAANRKGQKEGAGVNRTLGHLKKKGSHMKHRL